MYNEIYRTTDKEDTILEFFTEREVAEILKISMPTLKHLRENGAISFRKLTDRVIRYTKADIEKYIENCKVNK